MKIMAAIPSRSNFDGLSAVVDHCFNYEEISKVVVYDNGYEDKQQVEAMTEWGVRVDAVGWRFYRMWNDAWRTAFEEGFDAVAILNDDIKMCAGGITIAASGFVELPEAGIIGLNYNRNLDQGIGQALYRKVSGSYRNHGIGGFAFLVRSSTWGVVPPIDENYYLWYGDDELFANMEKTGFTLHIASGVPVEHEASTTANKHPELLAKTSEDEERFRARFA